MKRNFLLPFLLLAATVMLPACATNHSAKSIETWVVDEQTGQPLEGVIVVAHWQLERTFAIPPGVTGYDPRGPLQLKVMEAVTDPQGRFYFPAWGPLVAPPGAYLEVFDPAIVMFKPGYEFYFTAHKPLERIDSTISSTRTSWVDGKTIKMKKFEGDLKGYADHLMELGSDLRFISESGHQHCYWKQIPHMLAAIHKQRQLFQENKIFDYLPRIDSLLFQDQCGSAQEFLKEYFE